MQQSRYPEHHDDADHTDDQPLRATRTNGAALAAYITAQQTARALLADITRYLDAHQESLCPDEIHWGHVGDINATITALKNVAV